MSKKYVGIDIGGTNLKAGVVDETGTLLSAAKTPLQFTTPEAFVETLAGLSRQAAEAAGIGAEEICAVGMGVPGEVDTEHGTILYTCNIPLADLPVLSLIHISFARTAGTAGGGHRRAGRGAPLPGKRQQPDPSLGAGQPLGGAVQGIARRGLCAGL